MNWLPSLILLSLALLSPWVNAVEQPSTVLSFREWKMVEVKTMQDRVAAHKKELAELTGREFVSAEDFTAERARIERDLKKCEFNLELVHELAVNDYFVLYLSRFPDKQSAFFRAAQKLDASELTELMLAYDRHLSNGARPVSEPTALILEESPVKVSEPSL